MDTVVIYSQDKRIITELQNALHSFQSAFDFEFKVVSFTEAAKAIQACLDGPVTIFYVGGPLQAEEAGKIQYELAGLRVPPFLCVQAQVAERNLKSYPENLYKLIPDFPEKPFFELVVRSAILRSGRKVHKDFLRDLSFGSAKIIFENSTIKFKVTSIKTPPFHFENEVAVTCNFVANGMGGVVGLAGSKDSLSVISQKMMAMQPNEITDEIIAEVLRELMNQVFGHIKTCFYAKGFLVEPTLFLTLCGQHSIKESQVQNSLCAALEFEGLKLNLLVGYSTSVHFQNITKSLDPNAINSLDYRLLKILIGSLHLQVPHAPSTFQPAKITAVPKALTSFQDILLIHLVGPRGYISVWLDWSASVFKYLIDPKKETEPSEKDRTEFILKFIKILKKNLGNNGHKINSVSLFKITARTADARFMFRNNGYYMSLTDNNSQEPFTICFGIDTKAQPNFFDIQEALQVS